MDTKITLTGRVLLICIISYFTYSLLTKSLPWIFLDNANLFIHEGGHLVFSPFGQFIYMLGGSLMQIVMPCAFFVYFLLRKEYFATSAMLFWIGDNIVSVGTYMADANVMQLPLLSEGSTHDWNWLFGQLNLLWAAESIGRTFFYFGAFFAIASILGMIFFAPRRT